jgi:HK97 family phage major capsid protein
METINDTRLVEMKGQAVKLLTDATALFNKEDRTAEDVAKAKTMLVEAQGIRENIETLIQIKQAGQEFEKMALAPRKGDDTVLTPHGFKTGGQFLQEIHAVTHRGKPNQHLKTWHDASEPGDGKHTGESGWMETKDLVESIGASGGFLVPTEMPDKFLMWDDTGDNMQAERRATRIPMRRRAIQIPALNQGATTAGQPHWWGGVLAKWTEEAGTKTETEPTFRQIELVAHKLVCYTEASDELLEDSAISLQALLNQIFTAVSQWERQNAFINGSGAGQPLGVISAPCTIALNPAAANAIGVNDLARMLESFQGVNPVWFLSRRWMSELLQLNGPAANPSYVFMPSARDGYPATLFGFPLFFVEQMPGPGSNGSVLLADWSKYIVGDRQAITVDTTKIYRFQNDITSWRCVSRVDGQPWLNLPLTWSDGTTQTSPFVILSGTAGGS